MCTCPPSNLRTITLVKAGHTHLFRCALGEEGTLVKLLASRVAPGPLDSGSSSLDAFDLAIIAGELGVQIVNPFSAPTATLPVR